MIRALGMVAVLIAALTLGGCAHRAQTSVDPTLPEPVTDVGDTAPSSVLAGGAENGDPTARAASLAFLIGTTGDTAGGPWTLRALYDPSSWVQRGAVEALSTRLAEPETVKILEDYVARDTADPYVRGMAGIRLAPIGSEAARASLTAAYQAEPELWRAAPLALGAAALGDADAIGPLSAALERGEVALEVQFLLDLAASGHAELLPALREGADKVEDEMRLPYAVALIALGDVSGEQELRRAISSDIEEERLEALDYLSALDHPTATALLKRARAHGPEMVRTYAAMALSARTGTEMEGFEQAMASDDPEVRVLAVRFAAQSTLNPASNKRAERIARRVVREGLADTDATVRTEAMRALVRLDLHGDEELVRINLSDQYESLRIEAAGTLLHLARTH